MNDPAPPIIISAPGVAQILFASIHGGIGCLLLGAISVLWLLEPYGGIEQNSQSMLPVAALLFGVPVTVFLLLLQLGFLIWSSITLKRQTHIDVANTHSVLLANCREQIKLLVIRTWLSIAVMLMSLGVIYLLAMPGDKPLVFCLGMGSLLMGCQSVVIWKLALSVSKLYW